MRIRMRAVLLAALALMAATACEDPAPRATSSPSGSPSTRAATFSPPPLRLPAVAPGARCPTDTPRPWSGPGEASRVLGDGPLYPIADYFRDGAVLGLRSDDRRPDGQYEKKVRWLGVDYTGPVLLRADRIDGPGTASAQFAYFGDRRDDGYYAELTQAENDMPATTTVSGPGCYAYQVDGTTFSETIVFRAIAAK